MGGESYARGLGRRDELAVILYPEHAFLASNPGARGCSDLLLILFRVTEADRMFLRRLGRLQQPLDVLEEDANLLVVLGHVAG